MTAPDYRTCSFSTYGVACGKVTIGTEFCEKHDAAKCVSCGSPATHGCDFCGQFVCGAPLCDECVGRTDKGPSGVWGFMNHVHTKRGAPLPSEQREADDAAEAAAMLEAKFAGHAEDQ